MLYDIGFLLFSIFYLPTLIFKDKLHKDFLERFGVFSRCTEEALRIAAGGIWIEAVSVGEVALARILIPLLRERYPGKKIILSTITKAGRDLAKRSLPENDAVVIYFPLDFSFIVRKVVTLIKPGLYIMLETEIWPNILKEMRALKAKTLVINGRISDRSLGRYKIARPFLKKTLEAIDLFCMRSDADAKRIIELGAPRERVRITGNIKFDVHMSITSGQADDIAGELGLRSIDKLFVAGSTHKGEEGQVVGAFKRLQPGSRGVRLLIAPRHTERVGEVENIIRRAGLVPVRVSTLKGLNHSQTGDEVLVLDVIGRLSDIYSQASLVFIGGSLIKHGGHNPIEPAIFAKAIIFGPHMFNFHDIALLFLENGAALEALNSDDLFFKAKLLLQDEKKATAMGINAKELVLKNRGAAERNMAEIEKIYA